MKWLFVGTKANPKHALVDDEDFEKVSGFRWYPHYRQGRGEKSPSCYPRARKGTHGKWIYLHRLLAKARPGQLVDHKNCRTMDCRKDNLRVCHPIGNSRNRRTWVTGKTSRYKGVHWDKRAGKWISEIDIGKKNRRRSRHDSEESAARAYDDLARVYFGMYARLNFPVGGERSALR